MSSINITTRITTAIIQASSSRLPTDASPPHTITPTKPALASSSKTTTNEPPLNQDLYLNQEIYLCFTNKYILISERTSQCITYVRTWANRVDFDGNYSHPVNPATIVPSNLNLNLRSLGGGGLASLTLLLNQQRAKEKEEENNEEQDDDSESEPESDVESIFDSDDRCEESTGKKKAGDLEQREDLEEQDPDVVFFNLLPLIQSWSMWLPAYESRVYRQIWQEALFIFSHFGIESFKTALTYLAPWWSLNKCDVVLKLLDFQKRLPHTFKLTVYRVTLDFEEYFDVGYRGRQHEYDY